MLISSNLGRCIIFFLASILIACDTGGSVALPTEDGNTVVGISNNPASGEMSFVENKHISAADSRTIVEAVANGLNPYSQLINDEFYCHYWDDSAFSDADETLTINGGNYSIASGSGRIEELINDDNRDVMFREGPLHNIAIDVFFGNFGQSFTLTIAGRPAHCYQRGAADEFSKIRFTAASVKAGEYNCRNVDTGQDVSFQINANGTYSLGPTEGTWKNDSGVIKSRYPDVTFNGGALGGLTLGYHEENDTGYRWFDWAVSNADGLFDNGQSVGPSQLNCWSFGTAWAFPVYGSRTADLPATSTLPLAGRYVREIEISNTSNEKQEAEHFWFDARGYAYRGPTPSVGLDCNRTQPNGLNFCDSYTFDGATIRFYSPIGNETASFSATSNNEILTLLGSRPTIPAKPLTAAELDGQWENFLWWNYGCVGGLCDNGYRKRTYAFNGAGRFILDIESLSTVGVITPDIETTAFAFGATDLSQAGDVLVRGTTFIRQYDDGDILRNFAVSMNNGKIAIEDLIYRRN